MIARIAELILSTEMYQNKTELLILKLSFNISQKTERKCKINH